MATNKNNNNNNNDNIDYKKKVIGDAQKSQRLHTRCNTIDTIYIKICIGNSMICSDI